jgi:hypothetical protein
MRDIGDREKTKQRTSIKRRKKQMRMKRRRRQKKRARRKRDRFHENWQRGTLRRKRQHLLLRCDL